MAETEEVSKEVPTVVGVEAKCGLDTRSSQNLPKPECNGINHHNQGNDLDNSYVFVSGADDVPDAAVGIKDVIADGFNISPETKTVAVNEKLDAESGEISDLLNEEVNGNEDPPVVNGESSLEDGKGIQVSVVELIGKTESSTEAEVKQVEDLDRNIESFTETVVEKVGDRDRIIDGNEKFDEITKSDPIPVFVENQGCRIGVSESVESGDSNNADGEHGNQINLSAYETSEACQGPQDVVVGVGEYELQDVSVEAAENEVKLTSNVVGTDMVEDVVECEVQDVSVMGEGEVKLLEVVKTAEHEASPLTSSALDLESAPINTKEEIDMVEDVVECELQDVSVKGEDEVKLSGEVVESAEHEVPLSVSLDLESNLTNTKEQTDVIEDAVEHELQDASVEPENEVNLAREVVETAEHGILLSTSSDLDLESSPVIAKEKSDTVENVFQGEVVETAEHEIPSSTSLDLGSESTPISTKEEIGVVEDVVDCELQDESMKGEDEVKLSGQVVETVEHEVPQSTSLDLDMESNPINTKEETDVGADVVDCELQDVHVNVEDEVKLSGEVVETVEHEVPLSTSLDLDMESNPVNTKEETDVGAGVVGRELQDVRVNVKDEMKLSGEVVETEEHEIPPSTSLDLDESHPINTKDEKDVVVEVVECESQDVSVKAKDLESNPIDTKEEIGVIANVVECQLQDASTKAGDEVKFSNEVVESAEHEIPSSTCHVHNFSATSSEAYSGDVTFTCRTEVSDTSNVNKEGADNIELETEDVEDMADQNNNTAPPGGSSANVVDREEASIKTKRKPFNFLIRVPRFDDENLREQIRLAKLNIEEKTKFRDAIQIQIQEKRASTQIHGIDYEYAKGEGRNARKLVRSKRMEIDSLQSVINKAKNAQSIGDIDRQIYNMEHMIQHETLPLKEEKQLIREIKQLKQLREELSSNMGSQDEIKQALEQREEAEGRLKILRKELDNLKNSVLKAEAAAVEAEKTYYDENKKVKELQAQFRAADDVRQAAYVQWQSLRKELSKKSQQFFKYKDDAAIASNLVFSRDTEALYHLCTNNVENFMELWNTNDEFRKNYVKFNARSTVWRLGTLDGRALGPDEVPPVLPSYVDPRVNNRIVSTPAKADLASQFPTLEVKQERTAESVTSEGKLMKKATEEKNQRVTNKGPAIDITYEVHEEPKKSREENEAIRKAEEKKKEEDEAKLKEERRLEALAKAHEARERKKRQAEKLQMRAELKTLKEAEQKEKEREKRLRKKERKKAAATDINDINSCEIAASSESSVETNKDVDVKDASSVTSKKPKKHWLFGKQGKTKSIPPPLRNRNKKKLQQWMWVGVTSAAILVLFWLGNIGMFSNVNFKRRSPVI